MYCLLSHLFHGSNVLSLCLSERGFVMAGFHKFWFIKCKSSIILVVHVIRMYPSISLLSVEFIVYCNFRTNPCMQNVELDTQIILFTIQTCYAVK